MRHEDENSIYSAKVAFNGDFRRFPLEGLSFNKLHGQIVELFGLEKDTALLVRYIDDEGDKITMSSDLELREAMGISKGVLRLEASCQAQSNVPTTDEKKAYGAPQPPLMPIQVADPKHIYKEEKHLLKEQRQVFRQEWRQWREQRKGGGWPHHHRLHAARVSCLEGKLIARHVKDVTIEDGSEVPPNTSFVKTWRIRNEGPAWPAGCKLMFVSRNGDRMGAAESVPVPVEGLVQPSQEVDISVSLTSPAQPGRYVGYWRLCTPDGRKFGQRVWVSIVVPGSSSSDETISESIPSKYGELADTIVDMGFALKRPRIVCLLHKHNGDVDRVVKILTKRGKGLPVAPKA
jgi:hypothetical protein